MNKILLIATILTLSSLSVYSQNVTVKTADGKEYKTTVRVRNIDPQEVEEEVSEDLIQEQVIIGTPVKMSKRKARRELREESPRERYTYQSIEREGIGSEELLGIAIGYEAIPAANFSDMLHNVSLQFAIQNFIVDGFVGGFKNIPVVNTSSSSSSQATVTEEFKLTWGVLVGYKVKLNDKFNIFPLIGVAKVDFLEDTDPYINYGIGMHYNITDKIFLNYKATRYTASVGVGIRMYN